MIEVWNGFQNLWKRKDSDYIKFEEILAYTKIYNVYDVEIFSFLITELDFFMIEVSQKIEKEKKEVRKVFSVFENTETKH